MGVTARGSVNFNDMNNINEESNVLQTDNSFLTKQVAGLQTSIISQASNLNQVELRDPTSVENLLKINEGDPVYPKQGNYYSRSNLLKFQNIDSVENL